MSNQQDEIFSVDSTAAVEHKMVMGQALERLQANADFKTLILQGYLGQKVMASVSLLAVPQIKEKGHRGDVMEDLVAASNLQYFLQKVESDYEDAQDPVYTDQELAEMEADREAAH